MKGYRTIAINVAAIVAALTAHWGFDIDVTTIEVLTLALINLAMRFITNTDPMKSG